MHSRILLTATLIASLTSLSSLARAQYDYDDFMDAVEAGKAKTPPSLEMTYLAQVPSGPSTSASEVQALQPMEDGENIDEQNIPVPLPAPVPPSAQELQVPQTIPMEDLFEQQDIGLSDPTVSYNAGCQKCQGSVPRRECVHPQYQAPNLPSPTSLRGYFKASPCIANVWDGYSCEAAANCAKIQQKLAGGHTHGCSQCQACKKTCE